MEQTLLWLRWSWRDLRGRWPQVAAIALVIALGTGSYAGLSSETRWREINSDRTYESLNLHALRVEVAEGAYVPRGSLLAALDTIASRGDIDVAEERLAVDIQVDASTGNSAILVPGRLYGLDISTGGPKVDIPHAMEGRALAPADVGQPVAVVEHHFARHYDLPPSGVIRVSGGHTLEYAGQVITPEYIIVTTEGGGILAEANFAVLFASLETVHALVGTGNVVNELVLKTRPGTEIGPIEREMEAAIARELPSTGVTLTRGEDEPGVRINENDIEGDQALFNIFAVLIFGGAVVAAFNLTARVVDAQRREIGVAMVLGVPAWRIAIRPLLMGAQIAVLGVLFGVLVGYLIGMAMAVLLRDLVPLPQWDTSFQFWIFARVAAVGFIAPFLATLWPVWRAVRMSPVDAIRSGYRAMRGGGLAPLFRRLMPWGNTFQRMPLRNVLRAPRRSFLTALGIAASVTVLVGFAGLIDTFLRTIDRQDSFVGDDAERLEVQLDTFRPVSGAEVVAIRTSPASERSSAQLRLEGVLIAGGEEIAAQVDVLDMRNEVWAPALSRANPIEEPGVYLAPLALRDLGLRVGDSVTLRHPRLAPDGSVALVDTSLPVLGTHRHPFRFIAYMDLSAAPLFGLEGATNMLQVSPPAGASADDAKRTLFPLPAVTSTVGVRDTSEALRDLLNEFVGFLRVVEGAVLLLALLIAFNAASINADERTREHATMFAFGVPVRTAIGIAVVENFVIGVVATLAGIAGGWAVLRIVLATTVPNTLPDIDFVAYLSPLTIGLALVFGVLAVAAAPLLTIRRLRRMDIPAALKVSE